VVGNQKNKMRESHACCLECVRDPGGVFTEEKRLLYDLAETCLGELFFPSHPFSSKFLIISIRRGNSYIPIDTAVQVNAETPS